MNLMEPGSLQRMILMTVVFVGGALSYIAWVLHGGGFPPAVLMAFSLTMVSIGAVLRIRELEKQMLELKSQLAARQ